MLPMFDIALIAAILLCALVSGLTLGFALVVMPGIAKLSDRAFLQAFKEMDAIIQGGQPAFMVVWVGSIASVVAMLALGTQELSGDAHHLMWAASALYLLAVQGPTIRFNIPLNNAIQALEIESLSDSVLAEARAHFEAPWKRWNRFRTLAGIATVIALLVLQLLLR